MGAAVLPTRPERPLIGFCTAGASSSPVTCRATLRPGCFAVALVFEMSIAQSHRAWSRPCTGFTVFTKNPRACFARGPHRGDLHPELVTPRSPPAPASPSFPYPVLRGFSSSSSLSNLNPPTSINSAAKPAVNELRICGLRYDLPRPPRGDAAPGVGAPASHAGAAQSRATRVVLVPRNARARSQTDNKPTNGRGPRARGRLERRSARSGCSGGGRPGGGRSGAAASRSCRARRAQPQPSPAGSPGTLAAGRQPRQINL